MATAPNQPLAHEGHQLADDKLAQEALAHLGRSPALGLLTELLTRLREMRFPWWTPQHLRAAYPAVDRMRWLAARPDLRQRITTQLTGLAPKAARNKPPEFQAALIDSVIDDGDISVDDFEHAFEPVDLAVYGPGAEFWRLFRKRAPWDDDATVHQDLVGWLIGALLADKSSLDGAARLPVLQARDVRTAIDGRVWHTRIPLHVRVAIDDARFALSRDRPTEAFGAERDLAIATPALIAASVPLKDLAGVLDVAGAALGFEGGAREAGAAKAEPAGDTADEVPRVAPPRASVAPPAPAPSAPSSLVPPPPVPSPAPPPVVEPAPLAGPPTDPPAAFSFTDEATTDSPQRPDAEHRAEGDEMEHTNPWEVPQLTGEAARVAQEIRASSKGSGRGKRNRD